MNLHYFSGTVYGFETVGGPSAGMSNSLRLVLPISMAFWDMMLAYSVLSSSFSLSLALPGMYESGIDLSKLLVSSSNVG